MALSQHSIKTIFCLFYLPRTPQPFSLLDEVLNRLAIPRDKLSGLYEWKLSSVTLSSERVREVASCCCSNVSIRLPQSGEVTLLPLATLREIEAALRKQGSSAWLVSSAGTCSRPGTGGAQKIKKEPDGFASSSSCSSPSFPSQGTGSRANYGGLAYRHSNQSGNSQAGNGTGIHSFTTSSSSLQHASVPHPQLDKPEKSDSMRRSDALSRIPILSKMEQQAGAFASASNSSSSNHGLFPADVVGSGGGSGTATFRTSKQVLQPARELFLPSSTTPGGGVFKGKTLASPFSVVSALPSSTATTSATTASNSTSTAYAGTSTAYLPSSNSFFSKHAKVKTTASSSQSPASSSSPFSSSSSNSFLPSLGVNQQKSGRYQGSPSSLHSSWSSTTASTPPSMCFSSASEQQHPQQQQHQPLKQPLHQVEKKSGVGEHHQRSPHHQHHHHQHQQQQQSHQPAKQQHRTTPPSHSLSSSSYAKSSTMSSSSKEGRSTSSSGSSSQRKAKKDDPEGSWLNTPMFSDDSSSSPFHTSIDFDSENSD
ncbi:hypothetical protein PoB_000061300 [Plakobranchus ocellatus]|uniref:Uncharacterized protein n=1 Tax=Plakobranchus ocellatus TaxID=259542 RepID=A0AAV3XVV0_9GAST|nr:hypothetical protein PoB_000061300 [Plakobranchus ocellatus]